MRKGKYSFDPKKIGGISLSIVYSGLHISNTIISFHAIMFIIGFLTFPLFWPLLWILIYNNLGAVLAIVIPALVKPIIMVLAKKFTIAPYSFKNRRSEIKN